MNSSDQQDMFSQQVTQHPQRPEQLRRNTHPETSHQAAVAIFPRVNKLQLAVLTVMTQRMRWTHETLCAQFPTYVDSTIRTRCSELVKMGFVKAVDERENSRGNKCEVFEITELGHKRIKEGEL